MGGLIHNSEFALTQAFAQDEVIYLDVLHCLWLFTGGTGNWFSSIRWWWGYTRNVCTGCWIIFIFGFNVVVLSFVLVFRFVLVLSFVFIHNWSRSRIICVCFLLVFRTVWWIDLECLLLFEWFDLFFCDFFGFIGFIIAIFVVLRTDNWSLRFIVSTNISWTVWTC